MGGLRQFAIPFRGLEEGRHRFHFDIDGSFFEHFESSEIHRGDVIARVDLEKHSQFLELDFSLSGTVMVACDRCLEEFPLEIAHHARLYVRFGEQTHEQTDEVLILADSENELELGQYLYEFIHLALPCQRIHPGDGSGRGCNPEMTRVLGELSSEDSKSMETDPRWDKLKDI